MQVFSDDRTPLPILQTSKVKVNKLQLNVADKGKGHIQLEQEENKLIFETESKLLFTITSLVLRAVTNCTSKMLSKHIHMQIIEEL
jgi:hypothetical protein